MGRFVAAPDSRTLVLAVLAPSIARRIAPIIEITIAVNYPAAGHIIVVEVWVLITSRVSPVAIIIIEYAIAFPNSVPIGNIANPISASSTAIPATVFGIMTVYKLAAFLAV
ncbi:MAG: hypothetical protein M3R69_15360 [Acidobacteriota bacterium]|nr:hypothetical protein [Acidobacteriota bacterium]